MFVDPSGEFFMFVTAAIGAVAGAVAGGVVAATRGENVLTGVAVGTLAGGATGLTMGAATGAVAGLGAAATTGAIITTGVAETAVVGTVAAAGVGGYAATNSVIYAKKEQKRRPDSGLIGIPDATISERARDKSLPKKERERYKTEEKVRGDRNKQKRDKK
jgi:hypothetical protein